MPSGRSAPCRGAASVSDSGQSLTARARLWPRELVLAEDPHVQEDQHRENCREDERGGVRYADRPHPEPEVEEEHERPEERLDAVRYGRRPQVHAATLQTRTLVHK